MAGTALPGQEFDWYGRKISFLFLLKNDKGRFLNLICNPVNIVRYFEFPFVSHAVNWTRVESVLDVSSPRLFLIYLLQHYPKIHVEILNPDHDDLSETEKYLNVLNLKSRANLVNYDATQLPYANSSFDVITSISVIEHIPNNGDSLAITEMWRVLKPGGKLIITVPCAKSYYEEWRDTDVYGLGSVEKNGKMFFQRFYDDSTLRARLIEVIGREPISAKIFGERMGGTFNGYIERWMKLGLLETHKDPFYIVRDYVFFDKIEALPGIGICGLLFEKS